MLRLETCPIETSVLSVNQSDEYLMARIQEKDPQALEILYKRYFRILKSVVMRILHNEAESEDTLQEIFVELWNRATRYNAQKGQPLGWIVTLSRRRGIDRLRKRKSSNQAEERLFEETRHFTTEGVAHVEEDIAHREMRAQLAEVMAQLPTNQRDVIHYSYFKGMSQREIAAHTGIPLGTIKTRIELGLKKIAVALEGREDLLHC